jgi:hypothetical protein
MPAINLTDISNINVLSASLADADLTDPQATGYTIGYANSIRRLLSNWEHISLPSFTFQSSGGLTCVCFDDMAEVVSAYSACVDHWTSTFNISSSTRGRLQTAVNEAT